MTIPTLMQNHQRKVYVTQLHKVYNEFQQAALAQISSRNAINLLEAGVRSDADMRAFLKNKFKVVKDCTGTPSDCLADSYKNMDGADVTTYSDTNAPCLVLASGAAICAKYSPFTYYKASTVEDNRETFITTPALGDLIIDVNGKQGPNVLGRDLFLAGIFSDGTVASEISSVQTNAALMEQCAMDAATGEKVNCVNPSCQNATSLISRGPAAYCFDSIIKNNWEMNY